MEAYSAPVGYVFSLNAGGRSGTFDVVAGDFSTALAADTLNGIYVGLADNPTATTKVAKRRDCATLTPEMFGAARDGVSDDSDAFVGLLNALSDLDGLNIQLGAGTYKINSTALYFTRNHKFKGSSMASTTLDFSDCTAVVNAPYNCHMIWAHSNNITGTSVSATPITLPSGWVGNYGLHSICDAFAVIANPEVAEGNGVFVNCPVEHSNISVKDANLHNYVVSASTTSLETRDGVAGASGLGIGGNANNSVFYNIWTRNAVNGDGLHIKGSDTNACLFSHSNCGSNKGWGINDSSFLGNTHVQIHTSGNNYGAVTSTNDNNQSVFVGPYAEGGQGAENGSVTYDISNRAMILGCSGVNPTGEQTFIVGNQTGTIHGSNIIRADSASSKGGGEPYSRLGKDFIDLRTIDGEVWELGRVSSTYSGMTYSGVRSFLLKNSTLGATKKGVPYFANGFSLSRNHSQQADDVAPTTGEWIKGEIFWNTNPAPGGNVGWVCTTSGSPGTWKTFGSIEA
jgi:hypothetical protein